MICPGTHVPLLWRLREDLSGQGIAWGHQDSECATERSNVRDDLELVIDDADLRGFITILSRLGFKETYPVVSRSRAGLRYFCGYDPHFDRIVRLRARIRPEIEKSAGGNGHHRTEGTWERGPLALVSGGALIAVVGADGAGKTTALEALRLWLRPHFRVVTIHMGKPRWSWSTVPVKGLLKIMGALDRRRPRPAPPRGGTTDEPPGMRWLLWQAVTARDRYRAHRRARRLAARGVLVLCDRFPLPEVRSMDGLRGGQVPVDTRSRGTRWLAELVERYYAAIGRPDLLAVLSIRPDLAGRRRPEDPGDRTRMRALEILEIDWGATGARVLDSEQPMNALHRELKSWIWSRL